MSEIQQRVNLLARRMAAVALPTALVTSYFVIPFVIEKAYIDVSPYLASWKYDSYGARKIVVWLVQGKFLDHDRLPVLTVLLGLGIISAVRKRTEPAMVALALFSGWLLLYFGRPTWGKLIDFLPLHHGLLIHRFSAGVDLGAIFLVGVGGEWMWQQVRAITKGYVRLVSCELILLLMLPAVRERLDYYRINRIWMWAYERQFEADRDAALVIAKLKTLPPGRTYAGLRGSWGDQLGWGPIHFWDLLPFNQIPAVSAPYQGISLNSDMIWRFDDNNAAHYKLFNVRYVVAPAKMRTTGAFKPILKAGPYALYETPGGGFAEFARVTEWKAVDSQPTLFRENLSWFLGPEPANDHFVRWSYMGRDPGPGANPWDTDAKILDERVLPGEVDETVETPSPATLIFKMTYHPNWRVEIDGREHPDFMVSPSLIGVTVPAGTHVVKAIYRSSRLKDFLLAAGLLAGIAILIVEKRSPEAFGLSSD